MKLLMEDFFSKYKQIRWKLRIWSHLLKKSLMENFIFCAVIGPKFALTGILDHTGVIFMFFKTYLFCSRILVMYSRCFDINGVYIWSQEADESRMY